MKIVWDEPKRESNFRTHRLDFAEAAAADWTEAVIRPSYGGRYLAILPYDRTLIAIVFAPLGSEAISVISMRPASRQEREPMPKREVTSLSDEEEARIQAGIAQDPDNPEWTEADFAAAKPFTEVFPDLAASLRRRGPVRTKEAISIRIDSDVLEKLRASGEGWQSRVNDVLRAYVERNAA